MRSLPRRGSANFVLVRAKKHPRSLRGELAADEHVLQVIEAGILRSASMVVRRRTLVCPSETVARSSAGRRTRKAAESPLHSTLRIAIRETITASATNRRAPASWPYRSATVQGRNAGFRRSASRQPTKPGRDRTSTAKKMPAINPPAIRPGAEECAGADLGLVAMAGLPFHPPPHDATRENRGGRCDWQIRPTAKESDRMPHNSSVTE